METTQVFIEGWTDKESVVYTYIQCNIIQPYKENPAIYSNMDKPGGHYAR